MSFVVAVMKPGYTIVAGDTQLNDDNGKLESITGIKAFPISDQLVIGHAGNYEEERNAIGEFLAEHNKKKDFLGKTSLLASCLKKHCEKGNAILVETKPTKTRFAIMSDDYNWKFDLKEVPVFEVKTLLPPELNPDEGIRICKRYINPDAPDLRQCTIECVKAIADISDSVNKQVYGIEMDGVGLKEFTYGIDKEGITFTYGYSEK